MSKGYAPPTYPPPSYEPPPAQTHYGGSSDHYQTGLPGATYYTPPPPQAAPPVSSGPQNHGSNPIASFYAPPDNRSLGIKRRIFSILCCCILIGLVVGLAAGLTRRSYYHGCQWFRINADCYNRYGPGVYCYNNCRCVRG